MGSVNMDFSYYERNWPEWQVYYNKPAGKEPVFHVTAQNEICIIQNTAYNKRRYLAVSDVKLLAKIINLCKKEYTGYAGGGFCINEFGQVIVPLMPLRDRFSNMIWQSPRYVGDIFGDIIFYDDNTKEEFSLNTEFRCDALWPYPYLGMKYHLSNRDQIYMKMVEDNNLQIEYLPIRNQELVNSLRMIHPRGTCSFLVNPWGHVLTKQQNGGVWDPVYVCKLDYNKWFDKPDY